MNSARSGVTQAFLSDLGRVMTDAVHLEFVAKEWSYTGSDFMGAMTTPGRMRAKRNRLRKSWPELAQLLDEHTKANVMDGIADE